MRANGGNVVASQSSIMKAINAFVRSLREVGSAPRDRAQSAACRAPSGHVSLGPRPYRSRRFRCKATAQHALYTDNTVVRHGVLAKDEAFLQKPFTPHVLARRVKEVPDAREEGGGA